MGKKTPTVPAPPDPVATANAQAAANRETAITQRDLNLINQVTPGGNLAYTYGEPGPSGVATATATQTLSPGEQGVYNSDVQARQQLGNIANSQLGQLGQSLGTPFTISGVPNLPDRVNSVGANNSSFARTSNYGNDMRTSAPSGYSSQPSQPLAVVSTPSTPLYEGPTGKQNQNFMADLIAKGAVDPNDPNFYLNPEWQAYQAAEFEKTAPMRAAMQEQYDRQGYVGPADLYGGQGGGQGGGQYGGQYGGRGGQSGALQYSIKDAGTIGRTLDFTNLGDPNIERQRVEQGLMDRMDPYLQRDRTALESRLANQGIALGSKAYSTGIDEANRTYNDARLGAIAAGGQEQSRLFGLGLGQAQFANEAQNQQFSQNMANAGMNNAAVGQQFNQDVTSANFQNQQRQNAITEALLQRQTPLNEISALMSGSQVNSPQFVNNPTTSVASTDVTGPVYANYQGAMNNYNQRLQQNNAMMGGLFGLGGAALQSPWVSKWWGG